MTDPTVVALYQTAKDHQDAISRVRALHARVDLAPDGRTTVCGQCHDDDGMFVDWPCPTIQALDGEL